MSSSSSQRAALTQFMQFTQTPERTAKKILQANNWNLELAIDSYVPIPLPSYHKLYYNCHLLSPSPSPSSSLSP
ncbi:hypothetical protein TWF569_009267 [Orbilia oligospora]|nr:hypothetical protein TWF569_009267 [Orbilia oligospora]